MRRVHGLLVDLARLTALAIAPTWTRGVGPRQRSYGLEGYAGSAGHGCLGGRTLPASGVWGPSQGGVY